VSDGNDLLKRQFGPQPTAIEWADHCHSSLSGHRKRMPYGNNGSLQRRLLAAAAVFPVYRHHPKPRQQNRQQPTATATSGRVA